MTIGAVLLDLDDTLFDHRHGARQALAAVRSGHSGLAHVDPADFEERHARILEEIHLRVLAREISLDEARLERFRRLFESTGVSPLDAAVVQQAASTYRERYLQSWQEVRGATALLQALKARVRVGIVSNNLTREQHDKIRFCGFDRYLDTIVISEEAGVSKPDPQIFRTALQRLGADAGEAVMVGDAWHADIAGARAAGLRTVWFNPARTSRPEPWPDVGEIDALQPLPAVLAVILGDPYRLAR